MSRFSSVSRTLRLAGVILGGALAASACQTPQQIVTQHEDRLSAAGFLVKPANTPERQAMLSRLPAHKFVRESKDDTVHYVYADPLVCDCLYVGDEQAYNQFKRDEMQRKLLDEQAMTAQMYTDNAWNWGAWGPWGPGYRFGYGVGW